MAVKDSEPGRGAGRGRPTRRTTADADTRGSGRTADANVHGSAGSDPAARAGYRVARTGGRIVAADTKGGWQAVGEHLTKLGGELERAQQELSEIAEAAERMAGGPGDSITVQQLAEQTHVDPAAIVEFARTIGEILAAQSDPDTKVALDRKDVRRAALLSIAERVWEDELGPLLDTAAARELLGVSRQRVHELAGEHRLIVLRERSGRLRFPAFQFQEGSPPDPDLAAAYWTLAEHVSGWTAASWLTTATDALDQASPVAWLRRGGDPKLVRALAADDAERFAH